MLDLVAEHARIWLGRIVTGQGDEHEAFVRWLQSAEAAAQFEKYGLTGYSLIQHGDLLKVVLRAEEPLSFVRFLRNQRMWPPCWEFVSAGRADAASVEPPEETRVNWRRSRRAGCREVR